MMSATTGGSFWTGFAAGALSSIAASAWTGGDPSQCEWQGLGGKFADSGIGMIAFGTVAGGAGAQLTGGNFWVGAATGLVVSACNHYMHEIKANKELRNAGYDPSGDITDVSFDEREQYANQMKDRTQSLRKLYSKNGNTKIQYEDYSPNAESEFTDGKVFIHNRSFSTNRNLFFNILHEGVHAWDSFVGNYARWEAFGDRPYRNARAEIHAYDVERSFGAPVRNASLYLYYQSIAPTSYFNTYMGFKF